MVPKIKIILVDDHQVVLDALKLLFEAIDGIEVSYCYSSGKEALKCPELQNIDLLISDLNMPEMTGVDLALNFKKHAPQLKILMLTMVEDADKIRDAIRAGVAGYVLKKSGREELERAVKTIASGKKYFSEEVINELAHNFGEDLNQSSHETIEQLTPRELEILKLIAEEYNTKQIAEMLFVSVPTVETHRANLMRKLGAKSAIGMTKYAIKHGLVEG